MLKQLKLDNAQSRKSIIAQHIRHAWNCSSWPQKHEFKKKIIVDHFVSCIEEKDVISNKQLLDKENG